MWGSPFAWHVVYWSPCRTTRPTMVCQIGEYQAIAPLFVRTYISLSTLKTGRRDPENRTVTCGAAGGVCTVQHSPPRHCLVCCCGCTFLSPLPQPPFNLAVPLCCGPWTSVWEVWPSPWCGTCVTTRPRPSPSLLGTRTSYSCFLTTTVVGCNHCKISHVL